MVFDRVSVSTHTVHFKISTGKQYTLITHRQNRIRTEKQNWQKLQRVFLSFMKTSQMKPHEIHNFRASWPSHRYGLLTAFGSCELYFSIVGAISVTNVPLEDTRSGAVSGSARICEKFLIFFMKGINKWRSSIPSKSVHSVSCSNTIVKFVWASIPGGGLC